MASETHPKALSMGVALPLSLMQKNSCLSTAKASIGGNMKSISRSGTKEIRQIMITSAMMKVGTILWRRVKIWSVKKQ